MVDSLLVNPDCFGNCLLGGWLPLPKLPPSHNVDMLDSHFCLYRRSLLDPH